MWNQYVGELEYVCVHTGACELEDVSAMIVRCSEFWEMESIVNSGPYYMNGI